MCLPAGISAVSKYQVMLTSLVAAVPAAILIYLLVMALLLSEGLTMMAYIVMGGTLLASAITVLIPAGVLVGGRRKALAGKPVVPPASASMQSSGDIAAMDDDVEVFDDAIEASSEDDMASIGELEDDGESFEYGSMSGQAIDDLDESAVDTEAVDEYDSFELDNDKFEDFDLDDEPKPKKKKR